ncbi:virulence-associated protein VagC [Rhizobium leguminosarum]
MHSALERGLSDDFMAEGREQPEGQERPDLQDLFK